MGELERIEVPPIARPVVSTEEAVNAAQELRRMIAGVLVEKKHYTQIRGRDVLLKAGAEELQKVFGLSFTYSELSTWQPEDGPFSASVKCSVENAQGRTLAQSYGLYDASERKGANPNTVVKMAQKRAYVSAIMAATGTSELFTVDLDEDAAPAAEGPGPASTPDQRLLLAELFSKKKPCSFKEAEDWLNAQGAKAESERWVCKQITSLLLKSDPMGGGGDPSGSIVQSPPAAAPQRGDPELPPDPPEIEVEVEDDDVPF